MDNFPFYPSWFDKTFEKISRGRYYTFRIALTLLSQQANHNIVETGCVRYRGDFGGGGDSSFIFGMFISQYGGHLTTIDLSEKNMDVCRSETRVFSDKITYIVENSLKAIPKLTETIDLLYLDSMDIPEEGDATLGQEHALKEFKLAEKLLHAGSLILLDDNAMENGGKTKLVKEYLIGKAWLILDHHQSLWIMK